jgi:hypothetical protein
MSVSWKTVANAPPAFIKQLLRTCEVNESESISFLVQMEGNPMSEVKWLRNNSSPLFKDHFFDCCCFHRVKDGKQIKNKRKAAIIKQEGNVHS